MKPILRGCAFAGLWLLAVAPAAAATNAEIEALYAKAAAAQHAGDCQTAVPSYRRALRLVEALSADPADPSRLNMRLNIALCQYDLGRRLEAFDGLTEVLPWLEKLADFSPAQLALVYDRLGKAAHELERFGAEADALHRAAEVSRGDLRYDPLDRIDIQIREAVALRREGRDDEGRKLQEAALAEAGAPALAAHLPEVLNALGNHLQNGGFSDEATKLFDRMIALLGARPSMPLGVAFYNKAIALRSLGHEDEAFEAYRKSYDILAAVQGPNGPKALNALAGMGQAYDLSGHPTAAKTHLGEAFARAQKALGPDDKLSLLFENNLADVERKLEDWAGAERHDRDAYDRRRKALGEADGDTVASAFNLALDLEALHRLPEAEGLVAGLEKTLRVALGEESPDTLRARYLLGDIALRKGDLELAAQRLALFEAPAKVEKLVASLRPALLAAMARLAERRHDGEKALALYRRAYTSAVAAHGAESFDALTAEANLLAMEAEQPKPDIVARVADLNRKAVAWSAGEVGATRDPALRELALTMFRTTRGLAVGEALQRPSAASRLALFEAMEAWKGLGLRQERLLSSLASGPDAAAAKLAREVQSAREPLAAEKARIALAKIDPSYAEAVRRGGAGAGDTIARLKPGEVLLDYWVTPVASYGGRGQDHVVAVVVAHEGVKAARDLGEVGGVAGLLGAESMAKSQIGAVALYSLLVSPLEADIGAADTVYVAPDGDLYLAPFDSLAKGTDKYWIRDKRIVLVRNGASLARATASAGTGVVIFDGVDYGRGKVVSQLGLTEGPGVAALLKARGEKVTLLTGKAASKAALLGLAGSPRVLHLSTHAAFEAPESPADDPLDLAWIALAGVNADFVHGALTAREAMRLKLQGSELVVLSACRTAAGKATYAEGVAGLPSALAIAGARRTLLALWPVSVNGAKAFMLRFYKHLDAAPGDYEGALRATKLDAIRGDLPEAGDDWRAFTMLLN